MDWGKEKIYEIKELGFNESFSLAKYVSNLSLSKKIDNAGRIVIHVFDIWNHVDSNSKEIWIDLAESLGFYPYITNRMDITSEIRRSFHHSEYIKGIVFHKEQKILSNYIEKKKNIVVSAPTSFGKSLLIEEIVACNKHQNILIIQPTLALINETRMKLKKYGNYNLIVNTSQQAEQKNIFILTAERVLEFPNLPKIDYCILDEFYKISSIRDDERSDVLNIAVKKLLDNPNTSFYFIGPNIDKISVGFEEAYDAKFIKTDYSLVDTQVELVSIEYKTNGPRTREKEREIKLFEMLSSKGNEQSIVYMSSPARALKIATKYHQYLIVNDMLKKEEQLPINEWISENISKEWSFNKLLLQKIGVHSGTTPKHLTHSIIEYFNEKKLNVLFCTSTIIEGVNTSAKNVYIFDKMKGPKEIDYFDFSNIRGRAGRLLEHYIGKVYIFHEIPEKVKIELDIPFFDQEKISDEVLINFDKKEVLSKNTQRYDELVDYDESLLAIIRENAVSVEGQKKIIENIRQILRSNSEKILWSGQPSFKSLKYILNICWDNLLKDTETTRPMTRDKLPVVVYKYLINSSLKTMLNQEYDYLKERNPNWEHQRILDEAVSNYYREQRHWISYKVPKWLEVVDSLQKEICRITGIFETGDYSYVASQLENEGVAGNLSILLDMGIPSTAIDKIKPLLSDDLSFKEVVKLSKEIANSLDNDLLQYERDKLTKL